ncbi:MAG: hypothetical protein IJU03_10325 [Thermoguttaceae bacterium]|nr:hypothetical protein [Thermoguttaceae bacterium]
MKIDYDNVRKDEAERYDVPLLLRAHAALFEELWNRRRNAIWANDDAAAEKADDAMVDTVKSAIEMLRGWLED